MNLFVPFDYEPYGEIAAFLARFLSEILLDLVPLREQFADSSLPV